MSTIVTGNWALDLEPIVKDWTGMAYNQFESKYDKIFDMESSSRAFERIAHGQGLGLAKVKPEGQSFEYDSKSQQYNHVVTHVTYANGFIVSREMMEDGIAGVAVRNNSQDLAKSLLQTKEIIAADILNNGHDSGYTYGDGVELFSSAHPTSDADSRNELETATDLSEAALEQCLIDLHDMRDDRGLRAMVEARKLIIPKELIFEAHRIMNSVLRVGVADNDPNAIRDKGMIPDGIVMNPFLTDSDAFYLKTDVKNGLIGLQRRGMEVAVDNDFDNENAKFKATERYSFTVGDHRGAFSNKGGAV